MAFEFMQQVTKITKQWDISMYQDPWTQRNDKNNYYQRVKLGLVNPKEKKKVILYNIHTKEQIKQPSLLAASIFMNIDRCHLSRVARDGRTTREGWKVLYET